MEGWYNIGFFGGLVIWVFCVGVILLPVLGGLRVVLLTAGFGGLVVLCGWVFGV